MSGFSFPDYRLAQVRAQGVVPAQQIETPPGAFGANAGQLYYGAQQLERGGDALDKLAQQEQKTANDTRVQELNDQYLNEQNKLLLTNDDAFYRKKGSDAIHAAQPTSQRLDELRKSTLAQASNSYQQSELSARLSYHFNDASKAMGRHVATQSEVWQDAVAKGQVATGTNEMVLNYNDPAKIAVHAQGVWQTEYDRALKNTGSPEAAKAAADGVRSNALKATITRLAVDNPTAAQRLLDANREKIDATDAPALAATIKDASTRRRAQDIVSLVTTTGGVSPNYDAGVSGTESGGNLTIENKASGAFGKYQMLQSTYTSLAQSTEWGKGKSGAEIKTLLSEGKAGEKRQDELQGILRGQQTKALADAGVPANDLTLYMTHFLGTGAGPALLKLPDDTPLQAGLVKAHGGDAKFAQTVVDQNPFLAKVETVGDLKAVLAQRIGAPRTLATAGSPEKPNLEAMLSAGLVLAGEDPDTRDKVASMIKTDYATKHAIYTAQIGALEKRAFAHIDGGGTVQDLPADIKGALDSDGLTKVAAYEEKRLEKRRKDNAELAGKDLSKLEALGQLSMDEVDRRANDLPAKEVESWRRIASGRNRLDDAQAFERLQRGLGTRDMRDDIFAEHNAGNISNETRNSLLDKNGTFLQQSAPQTPYRVEHDRITRSLDPGLMGSGISREIYGRAVKTLDQYVQANPQRDDEKPEQFRKRLSDFTEDTIKRFQLINTQELSISKPVPANTTLNRGEMTSLPKAEATKKIAAANGDLAKKFGEGLITEEQYNMDALVLMDWLKFVQDKPEPAKPAR